ncbi:MAG: nitrous oxide reductase accessory protein NosL [Robiginitalea sp.]|uniref:nitrous oxide reductase accessory protein NosL n=1 Tax=Robiginitalea sp. TaxID=1902411 RepID=UPI003C74675B
MIFARRTKTSILLFQLLVLAGSCKVEPEPIVYGSDACHFCRMTIVERQYGAEMVTRKGKVYKFDAVECMLNQLRDLDAESVALFQVNTYSRPGELIDATQASYLVSQEVPSPMGGYLTAFESEAKAQIARTKYSGTVYAWKEIRNRFKE